MRRECLHPKFQWKIHCDYVRNSRCNKSPSYRNLPHGLVHFTGDLTGHESTFDHAVENPA